MSQPATFGSANITPVIRLGYIRISSPELQRPGVSSAYAELNGSDLMDGLDASLKTGERIVGVTVQAACGELHIISLWRLLAAAGIQMQSASSNCAKHADSERITISFTPVDATRADSILKSLEAERWITHAMLHVLSS